MAPKAAEIPGNSRVSACAAHGIAVQGSAMQSNAAQGTAAQRIAMHCIARQRKATQSVGVSNRLDSPRESSFGWVFPPECSASHRKALPRNVVQGSAPQGKAPQSTASQGTAAQRKAMQRKALEYPAVKRLPKRPLSGVFSAPGQGIAKKGTAPLRRAKPSNAGNSIARKCIARQ